MLERIKSKRLNMAELLSISMEIYKQNIKTILFMSLIIIIPLYLFNQWIVTKTAINLNHLYNMDIDMTGEMNAITSSSLYTLVSSAVQLVLQPLANIAIIYGAANIIKGQKSNHQNNFLYSFSKAPAAIWTNFLQTILLVLIIFSFGILGISVLLSTAFIIIIIVLCVVVTLYFVTTWIFADNVVALQSLSGFRALMTSKKAVKGYFMETFLYMVLCGILSFCLGGVLDKVLYNVNDTTYFICCAIWNFIHYATISGFYIVFMTVLYLNRVWITTNEYYILKQQNIEKMFYQSDENNSDLDKITEEKQQQQKDDDDK